jgi:hypothetical protein
MVDEAALCSCGYVTMFLMASELWKKWHGEDRVVRRIWWWVHS